MKLKRLLIAMLPLLFCCFSALAQTRTVTGKVTDSKDGSGVTNVTVNAKGTRIAARSDEDGVYSIKVPGDAAVLVFSSIGYTRKEMGIPANGGALDITMDAANSDLNEVVVVGYGTQRRRDVTGAISKISSEKINSIAAPSFEAALQGKAPGVQIIQGSGLAGSASVVRIRGIGSITASGDPLYVIDGIPIISDPFLRGNSSAMNQNPLASLNPNDIESVEVLKDAGAAGIYGSRGANGVILVTTKRGKSGKASFNYNNKLGLSTYANKPDFVNSAGWVQLRQEAWENDGNTGFATLPGYNNDQTSEAQKAADQALASTVNNDWWDQLTGTGVINEHNLSMNVGSKKLKVFSGLTYSNNEGYIKSNAYTRYGVRLNADYKVNNKFKIGLTSAFNKGINKRVPAAWDGGIGDAMSSALPIFPVYNANGTYFNNGANPVRRTNETKRREINNRFIGGLTLEYEVLKDLFLKATGSMEYITAFDDQFESNVWLNRSVPDSGFRKRSPYWGYNWTTTYTANYQFKLNQNNRFNVLLGVEAQESKLKEYNGEIGEFSDKPYYKDPSAYSDRRDTLVNNNTIASIEKSGGTFTFNSFFGRINYTLKDRYSFQLLARVDGSSKFGPNNKRGFFPAISGAWTLSEEDFLKGIDYINFLKLRASYGIVGNSGIISGLYYDNYRAGGITYNGGPTLYYNNFGNPDIKWETLRNFDLAVEFAVDKNRITGELAFYRKVTTAILLTPGISPSSGQNTAPRNVGESKVLNEGLELSLNYKVIDNQDMQWSIGGNIAKNFNKVLRWPLGPDAVQGGTNDTRIVEGLPIGVNYLVRYYGVDPTDGSPLWLDKSNKITKTYSLDHRVYVGRVVPDYIGGFNSAVSYKGVELSGLFTYVIGGNIYESSGKYQFLGVSNKNWNFREDYLDRWTKPGDVSKYPRLVSRASSYDGVSSEDQFNSTMFLHDASYLRLRELTLSYKIPGRLIERMKLKNARLFLTGMNLLTFSEYPGGDPEIARDFENAQDRNLSPNITYLTAPQQKSVIFGLNITF